MKFSIGFPLKHLSSALWAFPTVLSLKGESFSLKASIIFAVIDYYIINYFKSKRNPQASLNFKKSVFGSGVIFLAVLFFF